MRTYLWENVLSVVHLSNKMQNSPLKSEPLCYTLPHACHHWVLLESKWPRVGHFFFFCWEVNSVDLAHFKLKENSLNIGKFFIVFVKGLSNSIRRTCGGKWIYFSLIIFHMAPVKALYLMIVGIETFDLHLRCYILAFHDILLLECKLSL